MVESPPQQDNVSNHLVPKPGTCQFVWGGRAQVRKVLYMGALVAAKHNPAIREFYERLVESGKPKKLALTACMRKLITILNSMLRHGEYWREPAPQVPLEDCADTG